MTLYLFKGFCNYFNRIIKKYDTVQEYIDNANSYTTYSNINFNPADGVNTEQILNVIEDNADADYLITYDSDIVSRWFVLEVHRERNGQYRYLLKRDTIADNYDAIVDAPVFVEKATIDNITNPLLFNNEGMTFNQIKQNETPLMDESGCAWIVGYMPRDYTPAGDIVAELPYNGTEDISVNGISNWSYYSYFDSPYSHYQIQSVNMGVSTSRPYTWTRGQYSGTAIQRFTGTLYWNANEANSFNGSSTSVPSAVAIEYGDYVNARYPYILEDSDSNYSDFSLGIPDMMHDAISGILTDADIDRVGRLNNQIIKDTSNGKFYKIIVKYGDTVNGIETANGVVSNPAVTVYSNWLTYFNWWTSTISINKTDYSTKRIYIELEEMHSSIKASITNTRYHLNDSPYDMFCIPYGDNITIYQNGNVYCQTNKLAGLNIASQVSADLGNGNLYDIQLLPYCPVRNILSNNRIDFGNLLHTDITDSTGLIKYNVIFFCSESQFSFDINKEMKIRLDKIVSTQHENYQDNIYNEDVSWSDVSNETYSFSVSFDYLFTNIAAINKAVASITTDNGYIYTFDSDSDSYDNEITIDAFEAAPDPNNPTNAIITFSTPDELTDRIAYSFDFDVNIMYDIVTYEDITPLTLKLSNECDLFRLSSPNWNGQFDFSVAKMGGTLEGFNIDCTYKPFQPYIHVNPKFKGLYGADFNDPRGLICGGDFSLPQLSNAWANYKLNNKNYQEIFDRQMKNLDYNNKYQQVNDIINAATGSLQGGLTGGMAVGMMTGNPIAGAIAGGASTAISAGAGVADVFRNAALRRENKQYQIDQFNYNLGNIQAIPTSLTKVTAYNANNKIFPIVEFYTCTATERNALKNKLIYDGMTIMTIGTLRDYAGNQNFFKGELIRLPDLAEDYHMAIDIYNEISKGVYI